MLCLRPRDGSNMTRYVSKRTVVAALVALTLVAALGVAFNRARSRASKSEISARQARIPSTVLWAWERPTDLEFINAEEVGVAFLARTVFLRTDEVVTRPRLQGLTLPENARVIAVVRVESDRKDKPTLSTGQAERLAEAITEAAKPTNIAAVQIDFDATRSEREFYRNVIAGVRRHLPEKIGLSITALASWCADDDWLSDLPIDEAVPMLFRMGPDREHIRARVFAHEEFSSMPCRSSYGISTDEPIANLFRGKRLYVFNPRAWTRDSVHAVLESRK